MRILSPTDIAPPFANYSHGVMLPPGYDIVKTSGQLGLSAAGEIPADAFDQARICFDNTLSILAEAQMTARDVFHLQAYVTDRAHMQGYMKARDMFLEGVVARPTSTLMIVSGFTKPEFVVEVEVWAAKAP
ncbi:MAG: RidA family protein [Rhodobacteraceae bacterium]|nr:RidA family protein [Paracoccaceae bacterium]